MDLRPINFRPIFLGPSSTKQSNLFRSNAFNDKDTECVQWLRETMGIKSYVDLREKNEYSPSSKLDNFYINTKPYQKQKHKNEMGNMSEKYGYRFCISFVTFSYVWNFMCFKLTWLQIWRMIILLVQHLIYGDYEYQKHGGRCYFSSRELGDFYCSLVDDCKSIYKQIFYVMTNSDHFPMVVGCSFGKDRTGIVSALVMSLAGCQDELIVSEYSQSEVSLIY